MSFTLTSIVEWKHTTVVHFRQEKTLVFYYMLYYFEDKFFKFCLVFQKTLKLDFSHKFSFTILVIFQMIMFFQKTFIYSHTYVYLNEKSHPIFFVKSHEWNSSYRIEMEQWTHMIEYFIKFGNHLDGFWSMFALCSISIWL
jgi:hypothetical protein